MSYLRSINPAIVALLSVAIGLALAGFSLAGGAKPQSNSPSAVNTQSAGHQSSNRDSEHPIETVDPARSSDEFVGVTIARETIDVAAPTEGRLEAVYVSLGDRLNRGDRVARLNSDSIDRQLAIALASLLEAEADARRFQLALAEAEDRRARRRTLAVEGLLSKEEVVSSELQVKIAVTNLDAAGARVAERQARVAQVKDSLNDAELRAPFAGTVAARLANPGSTLRPGAPVISLIREGDLWVRFAAPQERLAAINAGSIVNVKIEAFNSATTAVVEHVAPAVDAVSQLLFVEARMKVPAAWRGKIKPGLTVRCEVAR